MSALVKMRPALAGRYAADQRLPHAKARGDLALQHPAFNKAFDLGDLGFRQFGASMLGPLARYAEAIAVGVKAVLLRCAPLQIIDTVVRFIAVDVVDLMGRGRRGAKERPGDQAVYREQGLASVKANRGSQIAASDRAKRQDSHPYTPATAPVRNHPFKSPKSPKVRYLMGVLVPLHAAPNFFHRLHLRAPDTLACHYHNEAYQTRNKGEIR